MVPSRIAEPPRRIRVARIITRLNVGGPAIQAMLLTARLDPARYESMLVCGLPGRNEGDMRRLRPAGSVDVVTVPELVREISPSWDIRAFTRVARILRVFRPDIVHTHLAKAGFVGRIAARAVGVPVVLHTYHGNVLRGYFDPISSVALLSLERMLARATTCIITISARQRAEIEHLGIASGAKLVDIPLGLDLEAFQDAPRGSIRHELGLEAGQPLIGIVARLVPIKAVDVFLEAAARIRQRRPEAVFAIAGDGEERSSLERRALDLGLGGVVRFLGWRSDLPEFYADCDVIALTSLNEGTPVSILEALASARPVVATDVGGVGDVLRSPDGDHGLLVPPGDAGALAEATMALLDAPQRARSLAERGRRYVLARHGAGALVRQIDALYSSLLQGHALT